MENLIFILAPIVALCIPASFVLVPEILDWRKERIKTAPQRKILHLIAQYSDAWIYMLLGAVAIIVVIVGSYLESFIILIIGSVSAVPCFMVANVKYRLYGRYTALDSILYILSWILIIPTIIIYYFIYKRQNARVVQTTSDNIKYNQVFDKGRGRVAQEGVHRYIETNSGERINLYNYDSVNGIAEDSSGRKYKIEGSATDKEVIHK